MPQQASAAVASVMDTARPEPDIALTAPLKLVAKAGEEIAFDVTLDTDEVLPSRSLIAIRTLPDGASFSQGRPYGQSEWSLRPDEIGDLRLRVPKGATGSSEIHVDLVAADGTILASAVTRLDIAPDPKQTLILRADESDRIDDLIAHGQKMIDVGYFAGARAYFKRAAEAGSGEARSARRRHLRSGVHRQDRRAGASRPIPRRPRSGSSRAKQLGIVDGEARLSELRGGGRFPGCRAAAARLPSALPPPAVSAPAETAAVPNAPINQVVVIGPEDSVPSGKEEWVALSSYANVRSAPSSNAETIKIAEKGTKLRVASRRGNWVQVTDPSTSETGWVYSRYVEETPSP